MVTLRVVIFQSELVASDHHIVNKTVTIESSPGILL